METSQNRIWAKARAFKQTIAAKIFALAVLLLLLTIGLAGFLLWEVARTERDLKIVALLDVPLTDSISSIHALLEDQIAVTRSGSAGSRLRYATGR